MENMNEKQSLQIITQMIETAKSNITNSSFHFLLWGWAVFVASITHYFLLVNNYPLHYLPWPILMTGAGITAGIYGYYDSKRAKVRTYIDNFFSTMWISIAIAIFLLLLLVSRLADYRTAYVVVMVVYGLGTLITGVVIRFKPLIAGGIIVWACAAAFLWVNFPEALLLMAFAILSSYIVPGYLLRFKRERKQQLAVQ